MSDKASIYIETSVVSYLAARPSSNLTAAAWQQVTYEWWENRRYYYDLYISELVITEAGRGDTDSAGKRLTYLNDIAQIVITDEARALAGTILRKRVCQKKLLPMHFIFRLPPATILIIFLHGIVHT